MHIKKIFSFLFILGILLPGLNAETKASPQPMTVSKEVQSGLPGKWKVIGCQLNGVWLPQSIFENFIYGIPDTTHFTLMWGELSYPKYVGGFPKSENGSIMLNTNVMPHTIDLIPAQGPFAGKTFQGIFELDHDVLKANLAFPGNPRPQVFSAGQNQVYEIWQRIQ